MPDSLDRLRDADPLAFLETPDGPPPGLLDEIVATPRAAPAGVRPGSRSPSPAWPPRPRSSPSPRRRPRSSASPSARTPPTAPDDDVVYTVSTVTDAAHHEVTHLEQWQRGDRMHNVITVTENGKAYRYEHDQRARSSGRSTTARSTRSTATSTPRTGPASRRTSRPSSTSSARRSRRRPTRARRPSTAIPPTPTRPTTSRTTSIRRPRCRLGACHLRAARRDDRRPADGEAAVRRPRRRGHIVETVDHFERMPATPANLALLDAPDIDAAG